MYLLKHGAEMGESWTLSSPTEEEPDPRGMELRGNLRQPGGCLKIVSPVSPRAARAKDALISETITRPPLPSLDRLPLGVTDHCHDVLGLTASWEGHRLGTSLHL